MSKYIIFKLVKVVQFNVIHSIIILMIEGKNEFRQDSVLDKGIVTMDSH